MWRRVYRLGRGMALGACTALGLLAGLAWVGVAISDKQHNFEVQWGGADGRRFWAFLNSHREPVSGWDTYVVFFSLGDDDGPAIERDRDWELREVLPGFSEVAPSGVCDLVLQDYAQLGSKQYVRYGAGTVPLCAPIAALGVWPLVAGARFAGRRRRLNCRRKLGLCLACGYDLRGLESARCPECGAVISSRETTGG